MSEEERKIYLELNHAVADYLEVKGGKKVRLRHGHAPVEIDETLYNKYKDVTNTVSLPISNKNLIVQIHKYKFTFEE